MISYKGTIRTYPYDRNILEDLINYLKNNNFYAPNREDTLVLSEKINAFLDSVTCVEAETTLERKETEEEARAYFGEEFIAFYNELVKRIDKSDAVMAIHGCSSAPKILESGLHYKSPSLSSTAVTQEMPFGDESFTVSNFNELLNWPHRGYKQLVLVGIPYECYYKEGLWEHFHESTSQFDLCYGIPSDFVIGYIDVDQRAVIMNPSYRRNHDYSSLVPDMEEYSKNPDMTPEKFKTALRGLAQEASETPRFNYTISNEVEVDEGNYISLLGDGAETIMGTLNGVYSFHKDGINEEYYQDVVRDLKRLLNIILKSQEYLLTKEEIARRKKEEEERFSSMIASGPVDDSFDWDSDLDWGDDAEFDEEVKRG